MSFAPRSLVVLSKDGHAKMLSTVTFPEWVIVQPIDGPGFLVTAALIRSHDAEELLLEWQAHSKYVEGANPPPFIENAEKRDASGEFSVDLRTGSPRIVADRSRHGHEVRHAIEHKGKPVWETWRYSVGEVSESRELKGWRVSVDELFEGLI